MKSKEERVFAVLKDPRFYRAAFVHLGNLSVGIPMTTRFEIGLRIGVGYVRWIYAESAEKAFEQAAQVLLDGANIASMPDYAG